MTRNSKKTKSSNEKQTSSVSTDKTKNEKSMNLQGMPAERWNVLAGSIIGAIGLIIAAVITSVPGMYPYWFLPTVTVQSNSTNVQVTPVLTATLPITPISSAIQSAQPITATSLMRIGRYRNTLCDDPAEIPATFDLEAEPTTVAQKIEEVINDGSWTTWPKAALWAVSADQAGSIELPLKIQHILRNAEWIELDNTFQIIVHVNQSLPEHTNILQFCGEGIGKIQTTSELVFLKTDELEYTSEVTFPEGDYYKLEPGEFELFNITFQCTAPGSYSILIQVPYIYAEQSGNLEFSENITCAQTATIWP